MNKPLVAIVMGSDSDWSVMKNAAQMLADFGVSYEASVVSAHRTPDLMFTFAKTAQQQGYKIIIAGAGGAAHLPGMIAALTPLPVLGVPVPSKHLQGQDSLLSIVQMPKGVPVATFAIGPIKEKNICKLNSKPMLLIWLPYGYVHSVTVKLDDILSIYFR